MTMKEYGLKFMQLSHYAPEMAVDMRNRMGLYFDKLNKWPKKDRRGAMLLSDIDVGRLIIYVPKVDEERQ